MCPKNGENIIPMVFIAVNMHLLTHMNILAEFGSVKMTGKKKDTTGGVRTHAELLPFDLKSNALTTRPPWLIVM